MDIISIINHVNVIRERHGVDPLHWSSETTQRARDLLDHVEATQSSSDSAAAANLEFGDNLALGMDGSVDPTTACIQALDIWQVNDVYDVSMKLRHVHEPLFT